MKELSARRHLRLGESELQQQLAALLPARVRDLCHVAMAVYVVDRLKNRPPGGRLNQLIMAIPQKCSKDRSLILGSV